MVRKQLGIELQRRRQHPAAAAGALLLRGPLSIASRSARGGTITSPTIDATQSDRAGFDQAFHPAFRRRERRRHGDDVRADHRACRSKYEMLYVGEWKQNLLLADRYGEGRVFLAGDAVHLVIPTGGLGMNTGVGDAIDLSWKLAATLQGWGGPQPARLLRDRAPAGRRAQRRGVALRHARAAQVARDLSAEIRDDTPEGAATRAESRAHRRCRAAQGERDDRRRARLSLYRLAADRGRAGRGAGARFHATMCRPPGRGAAAARLARRRDARCRTASATATATRCCGSAARAPILRRCSVRLRRLARRCRCSTFPMSSARHLRLTISCCCGRTCTSSGAAMRLRRRRKSWRRSRQAIG